MLESLGTARRRPARRGPHPVQHLLDPREGRRAAFAHLGEAKRLKRGVRERDRRRRRLLGAVGQGPSLRAVPVRRRRVRSRAGPQARRVPHERLAHRQGSSSSRASPGTCRPSASASPGVGADLRRLQLKLRLLHRAVDARARGSSRPPASSSPRSSASPPTACARSPCSARTSTPTGATCAPRARRRSRSSCARVDAVDGIDRIRYTSPHPKDMREDVIARHRRARRVCEHLHLPLQAGSSRVLKAMRRTYSRERYLERVALSASTSPTSLSPPTSSWGSRGRRRPTSRRPSRSSRRSATTARSPSSSRPGATPRRRPPRPVPHEVKVERMERLVRSCSGGRGAGPRFVGRTLEVLVEGPPHGPRPPARPHAPQQGRELHGPRRAGRACRGRDRLRDEPDARGRGAPPRPGRLALDVHPVTSLSRSVHT